MGKILYEYGDLSKDLTTGIKISDSGYSSDCFLILDPTSEHYRKIFKKFLFSDYVTPEIEYNYKQLLDMESDVFIFPEELVYLDDELIGYLMRYINGKELKETSRHILIDKLYEALIEVEQSIRYDMVSNGVRINDVNATNVIYTPDDKLKIIDTDFYDIDKEYIEYPQIKENLKIENYREYNFCMLGYIFKENISKECPNDLMDLYYKYMLSTQGKIPASIILEETKQRLEHLLQAKCERLSDIDHGFKLVRKRDRI